MKFWKGEIHYVTQVLLSMFFTCKIGDLKIAGLVCLQKKVCLPSLLQHIFWRFFNYAFKTN